MAIQIPNPGTGNGASGDNEFVLWSKVKDNFTDQTNAASKVVGTGNGQVPIYTGRGLSGLGYGGLAKAIYSSSTAEDMKDTGFYSLNANNPLALPTEYYDLYSSMLHISTLAGYSARLIMSNRSGGEILFQFAQWSTQGTSTERPYLRVYHSGNTKLDTNGAISPSSPTIDLYSDRIETNLDGEKMNPEFVRNGVGDYTIKNTTGLRVNDGWYIKIPNDMNGNPKVAVAADTDKDGNLSIKTYKRIFSMETFTFGPDLNEPLDIPEGRWIDLRFNDLPEEQLDEPIE